MAQNTTIPKKPNSGQSSDSILKNQANLNPPSNLHPNFTNFHNNSNFQNAKAPQTSKFESNSVIATNLQKANSPVNSPINSPKNYPPKNSIQNFQIPVPNSQKIKSINSPNSSQNNIKSIQNSKFQDNFVNPATSESILQPTSQPIPTNEIKPFVRQNQSDLQFNPKIEADKKWFPIIKEKLKTDQNSLKQTLENNYNSPSFEKTDTANKNLNQNKKTEKTTEKTKENFQPFIGENNDKIEIPEHLQNKVVKSTDQRLEEIHQKGEDFRNKDFRKEKINSTSNSQTEQNNNLGKNSSADSKNQQIEANLQAILESGRQKRQQKLEQEKLAKEKQNLPQDLAQNENLEKLEKLIKSGQSVVSKPKTNFTDYLEKLRNGNSQNGQNQNGQNYNLKNTKTQTAGQIGKNVGVSTGSSEIKTTAKEGLNKKEENSQNSQIEKSKEKPNTQILSKDSEIKSTSFQKIETTSLPNEKIIEQIRTIETPQESKSLNQSGNLGIKLGNGKLESTSLKESATLKDLPRETNLPKDLPKNEEVQSKKSQSIFERLDQIKNNALGKLGIGAISTTSLSLANAGIIGLNDGLTTELNLRGNLQEDFDATKILRLLQALAFSTGKNGQENLVNKLGQFDGQFFELNPAFPFTGKNNLFATFSNILQRQEEFLPLICKKEITKQNREKYLKAIQNHLESKENQRFWSTILFVSYQSGSEAAVFGPLAQLSANYNKLPFVKNLINRAFGIFEGTEITASGAINKFVEDFEKQIRKAYDEVKLKETYGTTLSANPSDIGKSGPNFESLITYQFTHRLLKEVAKDPKWGFLDKENIGAILPGTVLETEARFLLCRNSQNPAREVLVEIEIIRILALWFALKFRNFLNKLVEEQILLLRKEKKEKKGQENANLSTIAIIGTNLDKNAQKELERENQNGNYNSENYENSPQSEFDRQAEIDAKEAQEYAQNEAKTRQKATEQELQESQITDNNKVAKSTTNAKVHPAQIAAKKEKERIERDFKNGKITQKQKDLQIQNVEKSLAKQIQSYNSLSPNVVAAVGLGAGIGAANSASLSIGVNAIRDLAGNIVNQKGNQNIGQSSKFANGIYQSGQNDFQSSSNPTYNSTGNWQNPKPVQFGQNINGDDLGSFEDSTTYNAAGNFAAPQIVKKAQKEANLTEFGRIGAAQSSTSKNDLPNFGQNPLQNGSKSGQNSQNQNPNLSKTGLAVSGVGLTTGNEFGVGQNGQNLGTGINFGANFGENTSFENINSQIANLGANSQINGHSIAALLALAQINHKNHPNIDLSSSLKFSLVEILPHLSPEQISNLVKHLLGLFNQKQNIGIIQTAFGILETKFAIQEKNETEIKNRENSQNSNQNQSQNATNTRQNDNSQVGNNPNSQDNQNPQNKDSSTNPKTNLNNQNELPDLTIPKNNSPKFQPNSANPSGFVPFIPNQVSPKKIPENDLENSGNKDSNYNPQQNFGNNSKNSENLSSNSQTGQGGSQEISDYEDLNSQNGNYYQIILQILAEYCNVGAIQNPQNGETGIVPFLTENEYHQNYSKNGKVNNAEYKQDNLQSRETILQKVKTETGDQNLPNQIYETDFEKAKQKHNQTYLGNLGNIDDKDKSNWQNDNEQKEDSQGAIDPNINPNFQKDKKGEKTDKQKENQKENSEEEKPQTGQIIPENEPDKTEGSWLGSQQNYDEIGKKITDDNLAKENAKREQKIKNEKNGKNYDGENGNFQNTNSTSSGQNGQNSNPNSLGNRLGNKIKNSELGQKIANSPAGKFGTNALNKINQARQIMDDPAQFVRDEIAKKLRDAAIKSGLQSLGALGGSFGATIAGILIFIFIITMVIVGATAYSYCTKDPMAPIFNLTESSYQSLERAFGITPEDEKEKNILEKAAGFVIDRTGVGIVKGIYDAVTGAKIRVQSQVGRYIMKQCGISECYTGSSPADVKKGSGGTGTGVLEGLKDIDCSTKAMLETLSVNESNGNYYVRFPSTPFTGDHHPGILGCGQTTDGRQCSDAAGKYQMISTTAINWAILANLIPTDKIAEAETVRNICNSSPSGNECNSRLPGVLKSFPFDPASQEKMAAAYVNSIAGKAIKDAGTDRDKIGKLFCPNGPNSKVPSGEDSISGQWASAPCATQALDKGNPEGYLNEYIAKFIEFRKQSCVTTVAQNPSFNPLQFFGPIQVSANSPGNFQYDGEDEKVISLIKAGKVEDVITQINADRGSFEQQIRNKYIEPNTLKAIIAVIENGQKYGISRIRISSAYRAGDNPTSGHGSGQKIDIDAIVNTDGVTYSHMDAVGGNPGAIEVWKNLAYALKDTGGLNFIISGGKIYEALSQDPRMSGVQIIRDDSQNPIYGGIHEDHYDISINPNKTIASSLSPTTGVADGSGTDSLVGGSGSDSIDCVCDENGNLVPRSNIKSGTTGSGTTTTASGSLNISTADQWTAIITAILEASSLQGRIDVLAVLANRTGNNWGGIGSSVIDQAHAPSQFVALDGIPKGSIKDRESAINVLVNSGKGYTRETASKTLDETIAAVKNPSVVKESESKIKGFTSFKGTSQYGNRQSGDFLRQNGENFYHPDEDGRTYTPVPISTIFGNKTISFLPHPTEFFAKAWGGIEVQAAAKSEVVEYTGKDGVKVRGTLYTPEGFDPAKYKENIVILGHDGFNGDGSGTNYYNKNLGTGQRIADQGSPVFVMEYESGAASRGGPQIFSHDVDDTIQAMNMLQERLKIKNNFTLAGSSRGAGVSALAASRDSRVSKLAVAYPVAELSGWTNSNQVYNEARKRTGGDFTKLDLANNPPANKDVQILISYGDNDSVLKEGNPSAVASVQKYADSLKTKGYNVQTEIIKDGDHGYITVNSGLSEGEQKAQTNFLSFAGGKGNIATTTTGSIPRTVTGNNCNTFCVDTAGQLKRVRDGVVVADSSIGNSLLANNSEIETWSWEKFGEILGGIEAWAATSISKAEIPKDLQATLNTMLSDNKLDTTEINNLRDQVAGILGNPNLSAGDKTLYQNLKLMLDDSVNNKKEIKVGSGQGQFSLTIDSDLKKTNVVGGATGDSVAKPSPDLSSYKKCEEFKNGTSGGSGGSTFKNDGTVAKGAENLLQAMIKNSTGKKARGKCYEAVYHAGLMQAGFGKLTPDEIRKEIDQDIARSGRSHLYAKHFGEWLNDKGPDGQKNSTRLGIKNLLDTNPNMSPYDAPPGSIIVVTPGSPGTSDPEAGDITVRGIKFKDGLTAFYNDGEMGYNGPQSWNGSKATNGIGRVIGIYTPPT